MTGKTEINSDLSRGARWVERRPWIVFVFLAILLAIQITPKFKMSPDGVSYMSIAGNMLHGRIERLGSPHIRYAPGYPFFITPAFLFGERPFFAVQVVQWIYAMVLAIGVYAWFAKYAGRGAIWITALTMANAGYWDLFRTASSEIVFAPAVVWAGYFMARSLDARRWIGWAIAAVVVAGIACATRQAGAMLAGGFVLAAGMRALRGRIPWPRAIALCAIVVFFVGIVSWGLIVFDRWGIRQVSTGDSGYVAVFFQPGRTLGGQLAEGTRRQVAEIGRLLIPGMWKTHSREHEYLDINNVIFAAIFVLVVIGWWRLCRETDDPLALSLPFFLALYIVYPYDSGTRFTVPIFPVLGGSVWYLLKNHPKGRSDFFLIFVAIHIAVSVGFWLDDAAHVRRRYERWPDMEQVAAAIPRGTDVVAMRGEIDDRWMFLMCLTDRPIAPETDDEPVAGFADWVVDGRDQAVASGFDRIKFVGKYQLEKRATLK